MTYREIKKAIKAASRGQIEDGIPAYITQWGDCYESNFLPTDAISVSQLNRAIKEGTLLEDWDVWQVA